MSSPRVKISKSGLIYLNRKEASLDEMITELLRYKEKGFSIYYYREAILSAPSSKVEEIFHTIVSTGIQIKLGNEASSEWGELETFMMVSLFEFHFAIFKNGTFTFIPDGNREKVGYQGNTPHAQAILREVDALVSANRIIETPMTSPDKAMMDEIDTPPSLNVVVQYAGNKLWRSYYLKHQIPENIKSLMSDCKQLGLSLFPTNQESDK